MKYYEIVTIKNGDEYPEYEGLDLETALEAKAEALRYFEEGLTEHDKKNRSIECRVYDLPDDTDFSDKMEVADAICNCVGYNNF